MKYYDDCFRLVHVFLKPLDPASRWSSTWLKHPQIVQSPETNISPENRPFQRETIVFQPSIFRCELLVSGSVYSWFFGTGSWVWMAKRYIYIHLLIKGFSCAFVGGWSTTTSILMDVSENRGTPKSSILRGVFHYKPSILGYPLFLEPPI